MADNSLGAKVGVPVVLPTQRDIGSIAVTWLDNGVTGVTPTTNVAYGEQIANYLVLKFYMLQSNSALTNPLTMQLPAGYTIDTAKLAISGGNTGYCGPLTYYNGTIRLGANAIRFGATTNQIFFSDAAGTLLTTAALNNASRFLEGTLTIPIVEFAATATTAYGQGLATSAKAGLLDYYDAGTFTATITGGFVSNPTGTARYVRVGKQVTLFFPSITGTSNSTIAMTINGLPTSLYPSVQQAVLITVTDASTNQLGYLQISSAGLVSINRFTAINSITGGTTGSGNKGLLECAVTYLVA